MLNVRRLSSWKQKFCLDKSKGKVMLEVSFKVQGLVHYEFIPEGCIVNKEMYIKILCHLRNTVKRKHLEILSTKWLVPSTLQCTCASVICCQQVPCKAQGDGFGAPSTLPRLVTAQLFPVLATKRDLKEQFVSD
jgi:hypothetical protein